MANDVKKPLKIVSNPDSIKNKAKAVIVGSNLDGRDPYEFYALSWKEIGGFVKASGCYARKKQELTLWIPISSIIVVEEI